MAEQPGSWPRFSGVLVDGASARWLLALLADGRRRAALEGWRVPPPVVQLLRALEHDAAGHTSGSSPDRPEVVWMPAAEAALLLGVSARRVTQMANEGRVSARKRNGRWEIDAADVTAEVAARAGSDRKWPETDAEGACA